MNKNTIQCACGENYEEINLKKHIRKCLCFLKRFKLFDFKISNLLEQYFANKENIFLIRFLFKQYIKLIERKIKNYLKENEQKIKYEEAINKELLAPKKSYSALINKKDNNININIINEPIKNKNSSKKKSFFSLFSPNTIRCKYCKNIIEKDEICENEECQKLNVLECKEILDCGHNCLGVIGEINCPPCLDDNCKNYGNLYNQNKDTCCPICLVKLSSFPVVILGCNHYLHFLCLRKKLNKGENNKEKKLKFNFLKCPVCKKIIQCSYIPEIQKQIDIYHKLYIKVNEMIEQRVIYKQIYLENDEPFNLFIFYICFKCNEPYYAGTNSEIIQNIENKKFYGNKEDCLCGKDSFINNCKGQSYCSIHGYQYIEYKCKFCCKIASRFCSETHFCEECYYNKSNRKDGKYEIKKCYKDLCEFSGFHAPNGIEYCLGCFICRLESINKEFSIFNQQ